MNISWLGILNFVVLQWFFVRLSRVEDERTEDHVCYMWIYPIVPLTGWWSRYIWVHEIWPL